MIHDIMLRYVLDVFAPPHETADYGQEPRLVNADQFLIGKLVASLSTLDQFALGMGAAGSAAGWAGYTRIGHSRFHFWDVWHENSVTADSSF